MGLTMAGNAVASANTGGFVPYQFISKLYTEVLGRGADQSGWSSLVNYFDNNGCSRGSLEYAASSILDSSEFASLNYANPQRVEVLYRSLLNREPDQSGYTSNLTGLNNGVTWDTIIQGFYNSTEFGNDVAGLCSVYDTGFGTNPPIPLSPGSGYSGAEPGLQAALNATASGGTVYLAQGAVVPITSTLTIPPGVTLSTTGTPDPAHYANMGRLSRQPGWTGESVGVGAGANLRNVWVDGDRPRETDAVRLRYNVIVYAGTGTHISYDRLGNPAGATNIQLDQIDNALTCTNASVDHNLIDAYSVPHNGPVMQSDGISDGCPTSTVTANTVVDASDVGIILFRGDPTAQASQVYNNTVYQAGHASNAMLAADPETGNTANKTEDFSQAKIYNNTIWTSPAAPGSFAISDGTDAWFGSTSGIGTGATITNNTSGSLYVYVGSAIDISGMLNTTVTGNGFNYVASTDPNSTCPQEPVGASVSAGLASGTIQPYTDATYSACINTRI